MVRRRLIVSDLDGTLLGDESALARFAKWRSVCPRNISLVYASGRTFESVMSAVSMTALPEPDAVISAVGTQINGPPLGGRMTDWPQARAPKWNADLVRQALACHANLEIQPDECQSEFKVSYYLIDAQSEELANIQALLTHRGLSCELIYSSGRDLDVLPLGVNKGTAVQKLARFWALDLRDIIVCGDTGNDLAMFHIGCAGVVVGNAQDELKRIVGGHIYKAQAHYAAGVVEGLDYWLGGKRLLGVQRS